MLDTMRRHAGSWLIRLIIGGLALTFILFFGSTRLGTTFTSSTDQPAGKVDGIPIPSGEYRYLMENNFNALTKSFAGKPIPDFASSLVQSTTLQQLVPRVWLAHQAEQLGITITDDELATTIVKNFRQANGDFDPIAYKNQFLPSLENRYGLDYEAMLRKELTIAAAQQLFQKVELTQTPDLTAAQAEAATRWTFQTVAIDPQTLKTPTDDGTGKAQDLAKQFVALPTEKSWKQLAAKNGAEFHDVGPITIAERQKLFAEQLPIDTWTNIFQLTSANAVLRQPLVARSGTISVIRFVKKTDQLPAKDESTPPAPQNFLQAWVETALATAPVQTFVDKQGRR